MEVNFILEDRNLFVYTKRLLQSWIMKSYNEYVEHTLINEVLDLSFPFVSFDVLLVYEY